MFKLFLIAIAIIVFVILMAVVEVHKEEKKANKQKFK